MSRRTCCADPKRTIMSIALSISMATQPTLAAASTAAPSLQDPAQGAVSQTADGQASTEDVVPEKTAVQDVEEGGEEEAGAPSVEDDGEKGALEEKVAETDPAVEPPVIETSAVPDPVAGTNVSQAPLRVSSRALAKEDLPAPVFEVSFADGFDTDHVEVDRETMTVTLDLTVTNATVAPDGTRLWACLFIDGLGSPYFTPGSTRTVSWPVKVTSIDPRTGEVSWELPYRGYSSTDDLAGALTTASITSDAVGTVRTEVKAPEWSFSVDPESYASGVARDEETGRWYMPIAVVVRNGATASGDSLRVTGERVAEMDCGPVAAGGREYLSVMYFPTDEEFAANRIDASFDITLHGETRHTGLGSYLPDRLYDAGDETCPITAAVADATLPKGAKSGDTVTIPVKVTNTTDGELSGPVRMDVNGIQAAVSDGDIAPGQSVTVDVPYTVNVTDEANGNISPYITATVLGHSMKVPVDLEIPADKTPWTVTFDPDAEFPSGTGEGDPFEVWFDLANASDGDVAGPLTISGEGIDDFTLPFDSMGVGGTVSAAVRGTITADAASSRTMDLELTVSLGGHEETVPVTVGLPPVEPSWSFEADPLVEVVEPAVGGAGEVWFSVMNTGTVDVPGPLTVIGDGIDAYTLPVGSMGVGGYLSGAFTWHLTEDALLAGKADLAVTVSLGGTERDATVPVEVPQSAREAAREGLCPAVSCALAGDAALLPADTGAGSVVTVPMVFTNTTGNPGTLSVAGADPVPLGAGQTVTVDVPVLVTSVADDGIVSFAVPYEVLRDGDADGTFTVRGTVADSDVDPLVTADDSLSVDVALEEGFEVPSSVAAGDTLSYGLRVTNRGGRDLTSVSVNGFPLDLEAPLAPGSFVIVPVTHTVTGDEAASGKAPWTDTVTVASNGGSADVARPFELAADPVVEPGDDPADKPADDPAAEPSDDPVDEPSDDPADDPAVDPGDGPDADPAPVDPSDAGPSSGRGDDAAVRKTAVPSGERKASITALGDPVGPAQALLATGLAGLVPLVGSIAGRGKRH